MSPTKVSAVYVEHVDRAERAERQAAEAALDEEAWAAEMEEEEEEACENGCCACLCRLLWVPPRFRTLALVGVGVVVTLLLIWMHIELGGVHFDVGEGNGTDRLFF